MTWHAARCLIQVLLATSQTWQTPTRAAAAALELLAWQLVPVMAFLGGASRRILIADGVGLGKTIEAGLIIDEVLARRPWARVLVLTPAGLRAQWREELARRFGREAVIADLGWLGHAAHALPADVNPWGTIPLLVCSWDFAKRAEVLPGPDDLAWDLAVIDEAHALGAGTERAALAECVARRSRGVILLTATPPDGDPARLGALMALGAQPGEPPPLVIRRSRDAMAPALHRRSHILRVRPSPDSRHLQELLAQYTARVEREGPASATGHARLALQVLRKRAASCAWALATTARRRRELLAEQPNEPTQAALPLTIESAGNLTDDIPDNWLQAPGLANRRAELAWLARLEDAARLASRTERKIAVLRRLVGRVREPVLAFTEYRDTLLHITARLRDLGDVAVLHGDLGPWERQHVIDRFTRGHVRLLLSTDVASEGLNLHESCRLVVMLDLPWTRSRLEQRIGRLDRLGQRRRVHAITFVTESPLDLELLARVQSEPPPGPTGSPVVDDEVSAAMGRHLHWQREALHKLLRETTGRIVRQAPALLRESHDRARGALDARRIRISMLPRRRDSRTWSGMVVVVEGCLLASDETLIDRSALALHVPLPVPRFSRRSSARRFVEQHLDLLTSHLLAEARRYLSPRWRASTEDWMRYRQRIVDPRPEAGGVVPDPPRNAQPSLFGTYDARAGAFLRTPRTRPIHSPVEPIGAPLAVHERLTHVLVLLREGPGTPPLPDSATGAS